MWNKWNCLKLTLCLLISVSDCANIFTLLPSPSTSHLIIEMAVVRAMAERNHNVTVVSVLPLKSEWLHPNITYIQLDRGLFDMNTAINSTKNTGFGRVGSVMNMFNEMTAALEDVLKDPKMQELRNNRGNRFDLMLYGYMFGDFLFGLAEDFDCPLALLWPNIPIVPILKLMGSPIEVTYTVTAMMNMNADTEGFVFRVRNIFAIVVDFIITLIRDNLSRSAYE